MAAVGSRGSAGETRVKPSPDAYVGLLGISLLALTAAMLFAYLNWSLISEKPKPVQMAPAGGGAARMPSPPGPGVVAPPAAPGVQPGGAGVPAPPAGGNVPQAGTPVPPPKK